jgi:hypothetical protein
MREDQVKVKHKDGGAIAFAAGEKYGLIIAAGKSAEKWIDGSPITRAEFEAVLEPHGPFEIAEGPQGASQEE